MPGVDVIVVGSGVTGLLASRGLARLGYDVALVERAPVFSAGATSTNEGWLHRGTYHAVSIADDRAAETVARRCIEGAKRLEALAPEALERGTAHPLAFTTTDRPSHIEDRWRAAGVAFRVLTPIAARRRAATLRWDDISAAYEVYDGAINTRMMAALLLRDARRLGVRLFQGTSLIGDVEADLVLVSACRQEPLQARLVLLTAGAGTPLAAADLGLPNTCMRFWTSHLAIVEPQTDLNLLSLDPNELTSINHGQIAVIGLNDDAQRSAGPGAEGTPEGGELLLRAMRRRLNDVPAVHRFVACTKVDLAANEQAARVLAPTVLRLAPRVLAAVPGKMTEAPYIVDRLLRHIVSMLGLAEVKPAPYEPSVTGECTDFPLGMPIIV